MSAHTIEERTLALAGILQAAELVRQVAQTGQCSLTAAHASIGSIFQTTPDSTESIYGSPEGLRLGHRMLVAILGGRPQSSDAQTLHYAMGLIKLSHKIWKQPKRQQALSEAIALSQSAWKDSQEPLDPSVVAQLADTYQRHISTLNFRIRIQGVPKILKSEDKVAIVRALLLAGVRAGFLWRQLGGNQWRLFVDRKAMVKQAERLI